MISALPGAVSSAAHAWDIMRDDVTLRQSLMTPGFNEEHQKDLLALHHEAQQSGNGGYYLPARVELEIRETNQRAQALYDACCEVWENHGLKRNRAFHRAAFDNCLQVLFGTRRVTIIAELQLMDVRMRTPGKSRAASGSLTRRMSQLAAHWNTKLEIETRDNETRERVARESVVLLRATQVQSAPTFKNREGDGRAHPRVGRTQRRPNEFTILAASLWKQKKGPKGRVSIHDLKAIGDELDSQKFTPPADYLERKAAKELKTRNSRNANSKNGGAIQTWSVLVTRADKDDLQAMRKLLIRCASKFP
jgi:hypothetical protein